MSVFHVPSVCANTNARGVDALVRLCEHVDTFCARRLVGEDFERVERELHERFVEAEREVLGQLLESLDVDVPSVELGERRLHRVLKSTESYTTAVGPVKVARTLYRSARERAVVPMELRAGIVEGHWTPLAARQASRVVAQMTPSEGEALLRELSRSTSTARRGAGGEGDRASARAIDLRHAHARRGVCREGHGWIRDGTTRTPASSSAASGQTLQSHPRADGASSVRSLRYEP